MAAAAQSFGLTFTDFLAKMKDPAAADLVRGIKSFIRQFEERASGHAVDPEADSARVQAFLAQSEQQFRQHPVWRGCQPEVLDQAVEGLEKYVMSKVWRQTFGVWQEDRERDERYQRLMQALGFVDLPTLMGGPVEPDASLLAMAQGELLKMDRYKAPRDKLLCLVNVKTMVENIVQLAASGGAGIGGADAFFPVFLFVVIRSRLPHLASNAEYVRRFRSRARLAGQFDYMLCNLESAAMYLDTAGYEHLGVSREAFLAHLAAAGIPEAHLELRRMHWQEQQQQDADRGANYSVLDGKEAAVGPPSPVSPLVEAGDRSTAGAPTEAPASRADTTTGAPGRADGAQSSSQVGHGAPEAEAAAEATCGREGSLTPLAGLENESPTLLGPEASEMRGEREAVQPVELRFDEQGAATPEAKQEAAAEASLLRGVLPPQPLLHGGAALVDELAAEGMQHVLAAEKTGQLQRRYPYMYAQAEDLALADVQAVLMGYKELLLRFEALSHAVQEQLGFPGCSNSTGHRPKRDQQQSGLSSVFQAPADIADALPSGEWSSGGILQRLTSSGHRQAPAAPLEGAAAASGGADDVHHSDDGRRSPLWLLSRSSPSHQTAQLATLLGGSTGSSLEPPAPLPLLPASDEHQGEDLLFSDEILADAPAGDSQQLSTSSMASRGNPGNCKDATGTFCLTGTAAGKAAAPSAPTQLPGFLDAMLHAQLAAQSVQTGDAPPHTEEAYLEECTSSAPVASQDDTANLARATLM